MTYGDTILFPEINYAVCLINIQSFFKRGSQLPEFDFSNVLIYRLRIKNVDHMHIEIQDLVAKGNCFQICLIYRFHVCIPLLLLFNTFYKIELLGTSHYFLKCFVCALLMSVMKIKFNLSICENVVQNVSSHSLVF